MLCSLTKFNLFNCTYSITFRDKRSSP
jgi:hypothetical protein